MLAHCLGCKAELAGSHIASVLFYLEATTRIHEKLTCTQVKLQTYVNEMPYARAKNIDFHRLTSSGQRKARPEREDLQQPQASNQQPLFSAASSPGTASAGASAPQRASAPSKEDGSTLCQTQPVQN